MGKHKHAEVIHAWADGAQVQVKGHNGWIDEKNTPSFNAVAEYRIKPAEKVVRWLWAYKHNDKWYTNNRYATEAEFYEIYTGVDTYKKLEWSRETFDE